MSIRYRRGIWILVLLGAIVGCGGGGSSDSSSPDPDTELSPVTLKQAREQVIAWFPISIVDAPELRDIRRTIVNNGWEPFVRDGVQVALTHFNLRRVMIHDPFGRANGEPYQFDQYLEAQQTEGLEQVTDTFVEAWRRYITAAHLGFDVEVIAYIGSPWLDPDSQTVLEQQGEKAFNRRAQNAVEPFLRADMAIGYDAAAAAQQDSETYDFARWLRLAGTEVYIEATPRADYSWWFDFPTIILEETWQARLDDSRFVRREQLTDELIRIVRVDRDWINQHESEDWPEAMCRVIAEGDSLAVPDFLLRDPERRLEDLVACANDLAQQG